MLEGGRRIVFCFALNAVSSICAVYTNRLIFKENVFDYGMLLTVIYLFITSLYLLWCYFMNIFHRKPISIQKVMPLCLSFCGLVTLTSITLLYNSVSFYRLMMLLTTPTLVLIQIVLFHTTFSTKVTLSLTLTCAGAALAIGSSGPTNFWGLTVALAALLVTCTFQILVGTTQKELQCDSFQLLSVHAPISCVMLMPMAFLADDLPNKFYMPCWNTVIVIFLSGSVVFLANFSTFVVIGSTSPVAYNVLEHVKLGAMLVLDFLLVDGAMSFQNFAGIVMIGAGALWYLRTKMEEDAAVPKKAWMRTNVAKDRHAMDAEWYEKDT